MTRTTNYFIFLSLTISFCNGNKQSLSKQLRTASQATSGYGNIGEIPVPEGYQRTKVDEHSFGEWLRQIKLRKDSNVYLYNGMLKSNQLSQYVVLDIPVGNSDLQQCADAIMRLRAEYLFNENSIGAIHFRTTGGTELSFDRWLHGERYELKGSRLCAYVTSPSTANKRTQLEQFLKVVFTYCGTSSLVKETRPINVNDMEIGDVFVKAGGHAMLIVDLATNEKGDKVFLLAQSAMPAQDVHIVKNPTDGRLSPWYKITADSKIITPEWIFYRDQLKTW